jgi:Trk K+ transport system NAD-binding subunit
LYADLKQHGETISIIDKHQQNVDELINEGKPVVIGDPVEEINLLQTGIKYCQKAIILCNDARESMTIAYRIRKLNSTCKIYVRIF